jgi:hypothetical protein
LRIFSKEDFLQKKNKEEHKTLKQIISFKRKEKNSKYFARIEVVWILKYLFRLKGN